MTHPKRIKLKKAISEHPVVMGIVNCTPDSFSDGGDYNLESSAVAHAKRLSDEGCSILDIGGESTRPGSDFVTTDDEWARVQGVLETLVRDIDTPLSIDTYKASIAVRALNAGADIVNDVSGLKDPGMIDVLQDHSPIYVLMYQRDQELSETDIRLDMLRFFDEKLNELDQAGIDLDDVWIDPGIGFNKNEVQNLKLLSGLDCLSVFPNAVLVGASRKRFIGALTAKEPKDRLAGTLAAHLKSVQKGARIIRAHDGGQHVDAIKVMWALETSIEH